MLPIFYFQLEIIDASVDYIEVLQRRLYHMRLFQQESESNDGSLEKVCQNENESGLVTLGGGTSDAVQMKKFRTAKSNRRKTQRLIR